MIDVKDAIKDFFENRYESYDNKYQVLELKRKEFVQQFPAKLLNHMEIDDYVLGKKKKTFCYWLEYELKQLGSISGSPARLKFGAVYDKQLEEYRTITKWDSEENADNAFIKIKKAIQSLLVVGASGDIDMIIANSVSPMFKYKILTTYYPNKYLSVFSELHVDYFLKKLSIPFDKKLHVEEKRKLLLDYKNSLKEFKNNDNYFFTAFLYQWSNPKVKDIRLLPMSATKEFPDMTYEELQNEFFLDELINDRKGHYHFPEKGMNTGKGSLVLFQFNGQVIASAKLLQVKKHDEPLYGRYKGSYIFDTKSIKTFKPITADELREVDESFKQFSQSKQKIDSACYESLMELIQLKSQGLITEEIPEDETNKYPEGSKKQITVNAYERNPKARQECIRIHGSSCMICDFDFGEIYGEEFMGKIHVHHIKPLHEIDDEYEVDPEEDMVPVCPNCHMILHSKSGGTYTVEEVREFLDK